MANQKQVNISLKPDIEIEAFYASLESPSTTTSTMKNNPSEQTLKAIQILKHLFRKSFSLLLHPNRSITLKDTLNYLINLPQNEELSPSTRSEMMLLLQCFTQWSVDYYNAGVKLNAKIAEVENVGKVVNELEANVREFMEMDKEEKGYKFQYSRRESVFMRKIKLLKKGQELKATGDEMMIKVPILKAELECVKIIQGNIELAWGVLLQEFIQSTCFEEWV